MQEFLDTCKEYWTTYIFGLVSVALTARLYAIRKRQENQRKRQCALEAGMQALLQDRIIQAYDIYHEKKYITYRGLESVNTMWKSFSSLVADNPDVEGLVKTMRAMEVRMD